MRYFSQALAVNDAENYPLSRALLWLTLHARFPASRLAGEAELLVLLAAAAQGGENGPGGRPDFMVKSKDVAREAALRAHNERRKLVHYKCDNSAKV